LYRCSRSHLHDSTQVPHLQCPLCACLWLHSFRRVCGIHRGLHGKLRVWRHGGLRNRISLPSMVPPRLLCASYNVGIRSSLRSLDRLVVRGFDRLGASARVVSIQLENSLPGVVGAGWLPPRISTVCWSRLPSGIPSFLSSGDCEQAGCAFDRWNESEWWSDTDWNTL
jgi:hypothetical protein